jgi:hypothetical protein
MAVARTVVAVMAAADIVVVARTVAVAAVVTAVAVTVDQAAEEDSFSSLGFPNCRTTIELSLRRTLNTVVRY